MFSSRVTLSIVLLLALGVRIAALWVYRADLDQDPDAYVGLSQSLVDGSGFATPETHRPTAFRPPVYPLLLAGPQAVGVSASAAVIAVHLVSGLLTVFFTWRIARRRFRSIRYATLTTMLVAFDPLLLRYAAMPMTETVSAALCAMAVWFLLESVEPRGGTRFKPPSPRLRIFAVLGIVLGTAILCRPVFAAVAVCWCGLGICEASLRKWVDHVFGWLVVVGMMSVIWLPWIERNRRVFETLVPLTTHGGYTLLLANNDTFYDEVVRRPGHPVWSGVSLIQWQNSVRQQIQDDGIDPGNEIAADKWNHRRAMETIVRRKSDFFRALVLRWQRFFALAPANESDGGSLLVRWFTRLFYGIIFAGLAFSLVSSRKRLRADRYLWLVLVAFLLVHAVYWTNTRMRAPVVPVVAVLSMGGMERMMSQIRRLIERSSARK